MGISFYIVVNAGINLGRVPAVFRLGSAALQWRYGNKYTWTVKLCSLNEQYLSYLGTSSKARLGQVLVRLCS